MPIVPNTMIEDAARFDPDRTLASSFASGPARPRMIALISFEHEIAKSREAVSEPQLGAIRLQWWRDALDEVFEGRPVRRHPVAQALSDTIKEADLPRAPFDAMIDARLTDFEETPFKTWGEQESYGAATAGNLIRLSALACGAPALSEPLYLAASFAGAAWSLAGLMRALPVWAARRSSIVPLELEEDTGLDRESLFAGRPTPALSAAMAALGARVDKHTATANRFLKEAAPGEVFAAFAHATLARPYARRAAALPDPFRHVAAQSLLGRQARLVLAVARGRL